MDQSNGTFPLPGALEAGGPASLPEFLEKWQQFQQFQQKLTQASPPAKQERGRSRQWDDHSTDGYWTSKADSQAEDERRSRNRTSSPKRGHHSDKRDLGPYRSADQWETAGRGRRSSSKRGPHSDKRDQSSYRSEVTWDTAGRGRRSSSKRGQHSDRRDQGPYRSVDQPEKRGQDKSASSKNRIVFEERVKEKLVEVDMLPSAHYSLTADRVLYNKGNLKSSFNRVLPVAQPIRKQHVVHFSTKPMVLVTGRGDQNLPEPHKDSPAAFLKDPQYFLKPSWTPATHKQACQCFEVDLSCHHRPAVLTDVCLVRGQLNPDDFEVEPLGLENFESRSRMFHLNESKGTYLLGVPQPLQISDRWHQMFYEPVLSKAKASRQTELYCLLYNPGAFRKIAKVYRRPPHQWRTEEWHPYLGEAKEGTEMDLMTQTLYGLETVNRVGLTSHPCASVNIFLFTAMNHKTWSVPVYRMEQDKPYLLDELVKDLHKDWWRGGHGRVVCGLCILDRDAAGSKLCLLTRCEYIIHHRAVHYNAIVTVGTFSATGHHVRTYIAHTLYLLAMAGKSLAPVEDDSALSSTRASVLSRARVKYSDIIIGLRETGTTEEEDKISCVTVEDVEMDINSGRSSQLESSEASGDPEAERVLTFEEVLDETERMCQGYEL